MKYVIETTENGYIENLEVAGKIYIKEWIDTDSGVKDISASFAEQLKKDGADDTFAKAIEERIDKSSFGNDFFGIL